MLEIHFLHSSGKTCTDWGQFKISQSDVTDIYENSTLITDNICRKEQSFADVHGYFYIRLPFKKKKGLVFSLINTAVNWCF